MEALKFWYFLLRHGLSSVSAVSILYIMMSLSLSYLIEPECQNLPTLLESHCLISLSVFGSQPGSNGHLISPEFCSAHTQPSPGQRTCGKYIFRLLSLFFPHAGSSLPFRTQPFNSQQLQQPQSLIFAFSDQQNCFALLGPQPLI